MSGGLNMVYNSSREKLIIPEYGRNVQKLVDYAKKIEDDEYRQVFVERIVDLMMQMHPQNKNLDDYREKLWKHVFRISSYDLNVNAPNGKQPQPEDRLKKPQKVEYPSSQAKFRHYGNNVQQLIAKAQDMDEGGKKSGFVGVIASYMKLAYRTWNKEHYVSDEVIKNDLETLSEGSLEVDDNASLDNLTNANRRRKRSNDNNGRGDRDKGHHSNGRRGYRDRGQSRGRRRN